jgi:hypothetical protein
VTQVGAFARDLYPDGELLTCRLWNSRFSKQEEEKHAFAGGGY